MQLIFQCLNTHTHIQKRSEIIRRKHYSFVKHLAQRKNVCVHDKQLRPVTRHGKCVNCRGIAHSRIESTRNVDLSWLANFLNLILFYCSVCSFFLNDNVNFICSRFRRLLRIFRCCCCCGLSHINMHVKSRERRKRRIRMERFFRKEK